MKKILVALMLMFSLTAYAGPTVTKDMLEQVSNITNGYRPICGNSVYVVHKGKTTVIVVAHSRNTRALRGWIMAGAENVETLDKRPLLDKDDPVKTGCFMAIQFDGQRWNIVELENCHDLEK